MQSMTGWGRGFAAHDGREMTLEMKSVNHRFLDLNFRMPRSLSFLEEILRGWTKACGLLRGHIDITVSYRNTRADAQTVTIDSGRLDAYLKAVRKCRSVLGDFHKPNYTELLEQSGALIIEEAEEEKDTVTALAKECFAQAAKTMLEMRRLEGKNLAADLLSNLTAFAAIRDRIAERAPQVPQEYAKRLEQRMREWPREACDPARVAQEVALMADHCAIDEELSRLTSHIAQFRETVAHEEEAGKRLDFLLQEMNRETNTIGSKASDLDISKAVVDAKCILEKLREQVQNIM